MKLFSPSPVLSLFRRVCLLTVYQAKQRQRKIKVSLPCFKVVLDGRNDVSCENGVFSFLLLSDIIIP